MPKTRDQKREIVVKIANRLGKMKGAAFSSVSGFTMAQADKLRAKAAEKNVEVFIAKKTLLTLAAKEAGIDGVDATKLEGSVLTAVSYSDETSAAKVLKDLTKENEAIVILAGILEGKLIGAAEVKRLADLPSKEQLLGQLVGTLNAPISGFVNVLAGNLRGLVTVLGAIKEKKA
ncbi:MAG: 50S ribosomal protein L10 [Candidatus Uhrbacteria bacterium]|nr:50S ribosomal protein L10 [Candidatus Uhrbacteria bacterium]